MGDKTAIEWTDATWNPIVGCSVVSPGCTNCYAMKMAARLEWMQPGGHYRGTTQRSKGGAVWSGKLAQAPQHILIQPLRWRKPRRIFVNSMGDLFHEDIPDDWIDAVFAVMALAPQHIFQVLTKRSARMRAYFDADRSGVVDAAAKIATATCNAVAGEVARENLERGGDWPLPNVWLGVSAEDQQRADERIPDLLATPAAVRFVSAEPLLGEIDLETAWHGETALDAECWGDCGWCQQGHPPLPNCRRGKPSDYNNRPNVGLDWVIAGGESGEGARPVEADWIRSLRDQCGDAGVPFFFKQWGGRTPKSGGAQLDGREWRQLPAAA